MAADNRQFLRIALIARREFRRRGPPYQREYENASRFFKSRDDVRRSPIVRHYGSP